VRPLSIFKVGLSNLITFHLRASQSSPLLQHHHLQIFEGTYCILLWYCCLQTKGAHVNPSWSAVTYPPRLSSSWPDSRTLFPVHFLLDVLSMSLVRSHEPNEGQFSMGVAMAILPVPMSLLRVSHFPTSHSLRRLPSCHTPAASLVQSASTSSTSSVNVHCRCIIRSSPQAQISGDSQRAVWDGSCHAPLAHLCLNNEDSRMLFRNHLRRRAA
jgi:hypothetical protein